MRYRFVLSLLCLAATPSEAAQIRLGVTNLVSDVPGVARFTDATLINAWGIASSATGPFWVNSTDNGTSNIYNGGGVSPGLQVTIPGDGTATGIAFNSLAGAGSFNGDVFLFASEDGTVSGWRGSLGATAEVLVGADEANIYKGLAQAEVDGFSYAYAANFRNGTIDVFKGSGGAPDLTGSFVDPGLPSGYAPFNVAKVGGVLYVTYALQDADKEEEVTGPGLGIVDKFDLNGKFIERVVTGGPLNAPWGVAVAPSGWGDLANALLIGNFGDGRINAFDSGGALIGALLDSNGAPIVIDGLWGLRVGNGGNGGASNALYFTAGPEEEEHGLFGLIAPVPEPSSRAIVAGGLILVLMRVRKLKVDR